MKLLPGTCSPRAAARRSVCARGEGQAQRCRIKPLRAPWSLRGTLTQNTASERDSEQSEKTVFSAASFECCRKKEKPHGELEQPVKCSWINTSLQAAVETKTGSAAALPTSQLGQPTPG